MRIRVCFFKRSKDIVEEPGVAFLNSNEDVIFIVDAEGQRQAKVWSYNFNIEVEVNSGSPILNVA